MYIDIVKQVKQTGKSKLKISQEIQMSYESFLKLYNHKTSRIYFEKLEALCISLNCTPNDILKFGKPQDD